MPYNIMGYLSAMIVVMRIEKGDNTPKDRNINERMRTTGCLEDNLLLIISPKGQF